MYLYTPTIKDSLTNYHTNTDVCIHCIKLNDFCENNLLYIEQLNVWICNKFRLNEKY